jgi:hypothetical protein
MDHPLHDDSHLPEEVEMTDDNVNKLINRILSRLTQDDIEDYAKDAFKSIYDSNPDEFQEDWITYMEEK